MLKKIIKRDGRIEDFAPEKLNVWSQWAGKDLGDRINWSEVVLNTVKIAGETISSQDLQRLLIKQCVLHKKWGYSIMAGRLFNAIYRKELYDGKMPTVKELQLRLQENKYMAKLNYSRDDYAQIEQMIDHGRDFNMAYFQVKQIRQKYALQNRVTKEEFETPQFVFMRMAMALAEDERTDRLVHVKNWYDHFSFGRINAPTPNYTNLGTDHNGYSSCFPPGTKVDVIGGFKFIEKIIPGDLVLGISGKPRKVVGTTCKPYEGTMVSLACPVIINYKTKSTMDHRYYIMRDSVKQWLPASEIKNGDFLYHPLQVEDNTSIKTWDIINLNEEIINHGYNCINGFIGKVNVCDNPGEFNKRINSFKNAELRNNLDFYRLIGYFLAEGHALTEPDKKTGSIGFTINHKDFEYVQDIVQIFYSVFGITAYIHDDTEKDSCLRVNIHSWPLAELFIKLCGKGAANKGDKLGFFITSSKEAIEQCLVGYLRGDGCAYKSGYVADTISQDLASFIRDASLKLKYPTSIGEKIRGINEGYGNAKPLYSVRITLKPEDSLAIKTNKNIHNISPRKDAYQFSIFEDNGVFSRVTGIKYTPFIGIVYDFEVEEDHSFTVDGICVHNCCLYTTDDTARSLAIGDHIAYTMTYMSAGIGGYIGSRSLGDPVRGGSIQHQGKGPYFASLGKAVRANLQGGRGGACTTYYSCFDPEVKMITMLQNPRSPEDKKNRDIHFAIMTNRLFAKKVARNENIFTFNRFTCPELHQLFFSDKQDEFEELYNKYDKNPLFKKDYISAREICILFMTQGHEVATLYELCIDEANRHTSYKEPIYSSNLCVAGNTLILTREYGYQEIKSLEGQWVHVWNGREWSNTEICKTGINQALFSVNIDGSIIEATAYHKWHVAEFDDNGTFIRQIEKRTHELKTNDRLIDFDLAPVQHGTSTFIYSYENGSYTSSKLHQFTTETFFIPDNSYKLEDRISWLSGLLDSSAQLRKSTLSIESTRYDFLLKLKLMLQELGVHSRFVRAEQSSLNIHNSDIHRLMDLGLKIHQLSTYIPYRSSKETYYPIVIEVLNEGRIDDTYCFTEPIRNMGMFNGILAGNCIEIVQPTAPYEHMSDLYRAESVSQLKFRTHKGNEFVFPHTRLLSKDNDEDIYVGQLQPQDKIKIHGEHHTVTRILSSKQEPEVSLCSLAGIVVSNIKNDEEYASAAYYSLKMIDKCIHKSYYELPHVGFTAKSRLNAGVGILGLAHHLARLNLRYTDQEGLNEIHRVSERHAYFLISASLKLGQELGNAPWMWKTKWSEGWLPIDTYKKSVDNLTSVSYQYDWETLRQAIIRNKGIRNSSLIAHMPTESSSKASGAPNGVYPIRDLSLKKTDADNVLDWCAPDNDLIEDQYQLAWEVPFKKMVHVYAVIQKFTDQGISADFYKDRSQSLELNTEELITDYLEKVKYGVKSKYYQNSYTPVANKLNEISEDTGISLEALDIESQTQNTRGCSGDSCTL